MADQTSQVWHCLEPSTGLPLFGVEGDMSFGEWEAEVERVLADPRRRPGRFLSDRRRMAAAHSTAFIEQIVDFFVRRAGTLGPTRWAVLTADHDAVYGMVRMAQILAESTGVEVEAFTELGPALAWLMDGYDEKQRAGVERWVDRCVLGHTRAARRRPARSSPAYD